RRFKVYVINDLHRTWKGNIRVTIQCDDRVVGEQNKNCAVGSLAREILTFEQEFPRDKGDYQLVAELVTPEGNKVRSLRDFTIASAD
ncbi:MAG: hypothetical protein JSW47_19030, partial [Phycisphaerales bacterium]